MKKECRNHNIRFGMGDEAAVQAWECLHSAEVKQDFKSQNAFAVAAINDYYERHLAKKNDPYLESRQKIPGKKKCLSRKRMSFLITRLVCKFLKRS